ncbi:S1/P1 nuclease [Agarivorans sp. 1_MG-2023]|uniref:S1/P1 nuclease n=1 Tax=Agarivorans sp. 1_MG-2023 TaxID=3062634 RepID=UPI0026E3EECC|nr:S1/P1 nuclease [Agarivorans sp. 1_MG-2023]MDO6763015.1 S1/P1 nuclease [Agarivorans sp. 1_MG-2023]
MNRLTLLFIITLISLPSHAFGVLGHQLIAYIAQQQLTPHANHQIELLLDGQSLVNASTWADQARRTALWKHSGPWHYINIPEEQSLQQAKRSSKGDVLSQLKYFENTLLDQTLNNEERQQALKFYIHFVGDLHQPLHVAYAKDRGGNSTRVKWYGKTSNLHRVWDTQLLDTKHGSVEQYAQYLARNYPRTNTQGSYEDWLQETRALVPAAYQFSSIKLADEYAEQHRSSLEKQLMRAGTRLASKLNQLLATPN